MGLYLNCSSRQPMIKIMGMHPIKKPQVSFGSPEVFLNFYITAIIPKKMQTTINMAAIKAAKPHFMSEAPRP